jgi:putative membrane protein
MRFGHWVSFLVLVGGLATASACSDDEDPGTMGGSGGIGGAGRGGTGGGGQAGTAGRGGSGPDASGGSGGSGGSSGKAGGGGVAGATAGKGGTAGGGRGGAGGSPTADASDVADTGIRLTDAQVAGVLHAANLGEVQAAMLAEMRAVNAEVRTFAMMMNTEHSAADRDLMNLAADAGFAPADSPISITLTATAMQKLQALQPLQGAAFDRAYMTDQVDMHSQVLMLITDVLLPSSMNAALRMQVMMMQQSVTTHLANARRILMALSADGGDAGDGAADAADGAADASDVSDSAADSAGDADAATPDGRGDVSEGG